MKQLSVIPLIIVLLTFSSCNKEDSSTTPQPETVQEITGGTIFIDSDPQGASIFLMGTDIKKVTPDSIVNLEPGNYDVKLRLLKYADTSFSVAVHKNVRTSKEITLKDTTKPSLQATIKDSIWTDENNYYKFRFEVTFNLDVRIDTVYLYVPNGNYYRHNYNHEYITKNSQLIFPIAKEPFFKDKGIYKLQVNGSLDASGKEKFTIEKQIEVK